MRLLASVIVFWAALAPAGLRAQDGGSKKPAYGILLLSQGNGPDWNDRVIALSGQVNKKVPTEVSFGIYVGVAQIGDIQSAVDRLTRRGVKKIVAVPLFVNTKSEDVDQAGYAFGLSDDPAQKKESAREENPMAGMDKGKDIAEGKPFHSDFPDPENGDKRVHSKLPLVMTSALDGSPLLLDIVRSRAKALSHNPSRETLILLAEGLPDASSNEERLKALDELGAALNEKGKFRAVQSAALRLDAPQDAKDQATADLRRKVDAADQHGGTAVIVPVMLALGNVEQPLKNALDGAFYAWNGKTLLPDPRLANWVLEMGAEGAALQDERKYK